MSLVVQRRSHPCSRSAKDTRVSQVDVQAGERGDDTAFVVHRHHCSNVLVMSMYEPLADGETEGERRGAVDDWSG